ncbi:hypothetical protein AURDEDRAFT_125407 [Auricularia subglabra TFB-10046 SS5]|nr:hypothetical protein AURDEDRAFT_125407 [Auricularia subglabra TFB-10046 SS5]
MAMLFDTGSVLTGSLALYILLAREPIRYRSLSIAVAQSKFEIVTKYLLDARYTPYSDASRRALHSSLFPPGKTQVESAHTFMQTVDGRAFSVDVIQSRTEYAADAVQSHPSSLMHNFVSATDIVCLYPWFTFNNVSMATRNETPSRLVAVQLAKYKTWGMELHDFTDTRVCVQRYSDFTKLDEIFQRNRLPPRTLRDLYMEVEPTQQFRLGNNSEIEMVPTDSDLHPSKTLLTYVRTSGNSTVVKDTSADQLIDDIAEDAVENDTTDLKEGDAQDVDDDARSNVSGHSAHSLALRNAEVDKPETPVVEVAAANASFPLHRRCRTNNLQVVDADSKDKPVKVKTNLVQAKLQKPDGSKGIDWGYTGNVNERINVVRAMASAKSDTYAFGKTPANLAWTKVDDPDKDRHFVIGVGAGARKPVKMWGIGNVAKTYFFDNQGNPPFSVSVNVRLIHESDNAVANRLIMQHSVPRNTTATGYTDVRFGKWMSVRLPGDTMKTVRVCIARTG